MEALRVIELGNGKRYELLVELGRGGMGRVVLARAISYGGFERLVAIKTCHPAFEGDADFVETFLDEARIAARLSHPNIVSTIDVGHDGGPYIVMDYVEGGALAKLLSALRQQRRTMPVEVALRIAVDMLAGLQAAHDAKTISGMPLGMIHRDISPQNILIGVDGTSRIADFGTAKAATQVATTKEGNVKGKLGYMSPEQLSGAEVGQNSDVYSAAVVLWESLAGERLFLGNTESETMSLVLRGQTPNLSDLRGDVPRRLQAVLARGLAVDPVGRFASASDFADALLDVGVSPASPKDVAEFVEPWLRRILEERRSLAEEFVASGGADPRGVPEEVPRFHAGKLAAVLLLCVLCVAGVFALVSSSKHGAKGQDDVSTTAAQPRVENISSPTSEAVQLDASTRERPLERSTTGGPKSDASKLVIEQPSGDDIGDERPAKRHRPTRRTARRRNRPADSQGSQEYIPSGL